MSGPVSVVRSLEAELRGRARDALEWLSGERHGCYGLALVRIGYGVILLAMLLVNYADRRLLWGPESPWTPDLFRETLAVDGTFSVFAFSDSPIVFEMLYHGFIVVVILFILGWRGRWITPVLTVMVWSWHQREPWVLDGGDNLMMLMMIYFVLTDMSARWSLDARRRDGWLAEPSVGRSMATVLHNCGLIAAMIQVCVVYMNAGLLKVQGEVWQQGIALYYTLRIEESQLFPALNELLWRNPWFVTVGTYTAVFVQLLFPFLMLNKVTRRLGLVVVMSMHMGIAVVMALPFFSLTMIASDLLFIRTATYVRLSGVVRTWWQRAVN
ncbi:hypothetical protein Aph01nite_06090 [Acrocarpospora phusangensis]|uniref:HTTM-like domain-containing protein n=1 Tax=Acrocarpospora phusangensis TaxID=1070424 RepID=A0A919Q6U7_9ACTN|nr:HTTM domain-containing protein [Acrocarpospora phusangensis]GIH22299.1 hypothetical protein Aph01nite_06090 [Acrocarpospora phusangensis]